MKKHIQFIQLVLVIAIWFLPKISLATPSAPSAPTVTATSSTSISISWTAVSGATLYKLYRSTSSSGTYTQIYYAATPSYTDSGTHLSAGTTYYYKVKAEDSTGTSGYSSVSSAITYPASPSAPTVTATSSSSISISWSSVTGADDYRLYRATSSSGTYKQIYYASTPSYTDSGTHLSGGTTYYYKLKSENSSGTSDYSSVSSDTTYLSTPSAPTVTASGSTSMDISWSTVSGATDYRLYRATSSSGTYKQIYYASTPSYTDSGTHLSGGTTYYYKITAENSTVSSDYSSVSSAMTYPDSPSAPTATATGPESISLSWGTVTGGANYRLYRSTSSSGTYTQIYYASTPSYTDSGTHLSASTKYYYKLKAENSSGGLSDYSSVTSVTTLSGIPDVPSAPTVVANGPESITISWSAVSEATDYKVYRSTSSSGSYTQIYWNDDFSYTDDDSSVDHIDPSTTYYYKITAGNTYGWSDYSSATSVTTPSGIPDAPSAPTVTATGSTSIEISWTAVTDATLYKLYRSDSEAGSYTQIYYSTDPSYTDSGTHLSAGTTYYYKVTAGNTYGWSDYSSITSGTTEAETVILEKAVEGFLTLPLTDSNPYIYQGWTYNTIEISGSTTHEGIDFYCEEGDPIVAAADGVAMVAYGGGYGYFIRILHDNDMETMYGHLSSYISSLPYKGSDTAARNSSDYETWVEVTRGQTIGYCGSTETSVDHLHFELTSGGYGGSCSCRVDPYDIYNIDSYYPDFNTDSGVSCGENSYWTSCPPVNSDSSDGGSDTSGSSTGSDSGSDTSGDSSDSYYYAPSSYSTNDPDSSDTWHNVLRLDVSITGDEGTFVVTKFDSSDDSFGEDAFGTSGTLYLLTDSYDPSEGTIQDEQEIVSTGCGEGGTVKSVVLRTNFTGSSSKNYYVRYEASSGGYTTVGPIAINYGVETTSSPYVLSSTSTENDPDSSDTYHGVLRMDVSIANKTAVFTITKSTTTSFSSEGTMYLQVGEDDEYIFDYYANDSESIDPTCDDSSVTGDTITSVVLTRDLSGFGESDFPKTYYARFGDSAYTVVGPVTITYSASLGKVSSTDGGSSSSSDSSTTGSSSSGDGGSSPGSGGGGSSSTAGGSTSSDSGSTTGSSSSGEDLTDSDSDGVLDSSDLCPSTSPLSASDTVNSDGCSLSELDSDSDSLSDYVDPYPLSTDNDADGYVDTDCDNLNATIYPDATETCGDSVDQDCDGSDLECDTDGDGVGDSSDLCVSTGPLNSSDTINSNGCYLTELDSDSDGLSDYEEAVDESSFRTTEIKPSVETTSSRFGFSVATDGEKLLIGSPIAKGVTSSSGTATIYSWENGAWEAEAELMASDGTTLGNFGYSVSLDGDVALVGARGNDSGTTTGYAYIYRYDGTTWNQEAKLTPSDGRLKDMFGWSVSLSGDVAVVGTYYNRGSTSSTVVGSAYVYRYDGSTWNEETKLMASDGEAGDMFGKSVSINGDVILVGSHKDDDKATDAGAAYVYRYNGSSWDQEAKLTASDGTGTNYFGYSVSLDEDKAVVGAYLKSSNGAAYVFDFDGTSWSQEAKLKASDGAGYDNFGLSVSISGTSVVVGAWQDDDFGTSSGSAYVFTTDGSSWTQKEKLTPSSGEAGDYLGYSVAVRDDLVLVGAYGRGIGSAFVYDYADPVLTDPYDVDTDDDGILDGADSDPLVAISDEDTDGVPDSSDLCGSTSPLGTDDTVDADGCSLSQLDSDSDSLSDYADPYPLSADNDADGYTTTDCNNLDSSIYPGVFDTCGDSIDQDCDGADRECDSDGDGQESTVDGGEDCKDDDATIYNGASETCGDGLDQDCDGLDKECSVTYTVTSTDDANDGKCNTSHCSLREALSLSKTDTSALTVNVVFSIPSTDTGCSSGVCTISPTKALPSLTRGNTVVDGGGLIVIDGTSAGSTTKGITINDSYSNVIKNLTIQNFGSHGIYVTGTTSSNNEISGCYIGVDSSGTDQSNGGSGIYISSGSAVISKNSIAYNALKGVHLSGTSALGIIITQNSMHDNVSYGITLASSANNNKAKPVISAATVSGTTVTITGTATAGDTIEVFNASSDGEGEIYIGETTADSSGNWSYVTDTTTAPKWSKLVVTGTDSTNGTSPFSATKTVK